jgi:LacI family transcriptional regulator
MSIAGYGDEPVASQVWPKLTTIRQPVDQLAEQAAALLMRHLQNPNEPPGLLLGSVRSAAGCIVNRQSTGPAPGFPHN